MQIASVDPHDETWEIGDPTYRVYFHDVAGASDEYEIVGAAGVSDVLAWAEARRKRRTYVVHACMPYDGLGLLRLQGSDPNAS